MFEESVDQPRPNTLANLVHSLNNKEFVYVFYNTLRRMKSTITKKGLKWNFCQQQGDKTRFLWPTVNTQVQRLVHLHDPNRKSSCFSPF